MTKAKTPTEKKQTRGRRSTIAKKLSEMTVSEVKEEYAQAQKTVAEIEKYLKDLFKDLNFNKAQGAYLQQGNPQLPRFTSIDNQRGFGADSGTFEQAAPRLEAVGQPLPRSTAAPAQINAPVGGNQSSDSTLTAPLASPIMTDYYDEADPLNTQIEDSNPQIANQSIPNDVKGIPLNIQGDSPNEDQVATAIAADTQAEKEDRYFVGQKSTFVD